MICIVKDRFTHREIYRGTPSDCSAYMIAFGQCYVALSRVTSLEGLWIRGGRITQSVVMAHPSVLAFYRAIGCALD